MELPAQRILADYDLGAVSRDAQLRIEDEVVVLGVQFRHAGFEIDARFVFRGGDDSFAFQRHDLFLAFVGIIALDLKVIEGEAAVAELVEAQYREVVVVAGAAGRAVAVLYSVPYLHSSQGVLGHVVVDFHPKLNIRPLVLDEPRLRAVLRMAAFRGAGTDDVFASVLGEEEFADRGSPKREGFVSGAPDFGLEAELQVAVSVRLAPLGIQSADLVMRAVDGVDAGYLEILIAALVPGHGGAVGGNAGGQRPAVLPDHGNVRFIGLEVFLEDRVEVDRIHKSDAFLRAALFAQRDVLLNGRTRVVALEAGIEERVAFFSSDRHADRSHDRSALSAVDHELADGIRAGSLAEVGRQHDGLGLFETAGSFLK